AVLYLGSASGLATTPSWIAEGDQAGSHFGYSLATAGDVNGDGFDDVLVGAPFHDGPGFADDGRVFLYLGCATGLSPNGDSFNNRSQNGALFGWSVSTAGDVNADGYADFIIGAPYYDWNVTDSGAAFVYAGSPSGYPEIWNHGWMTDGDGG